MRILLASPIYRSAIETLARGHDLICGFNSNVDLRALVADRDVLVFRSGVSISAEVIEAGQKLKLLIRAGSGINNIDVGCARRRGIPLIRIRRPGSQGVAEFTFALMLDAARRVSEADRFVRQGRWPKRELGGRLIAGKTLGIVGVGNVGTRVGELGSAWGMRPIGCVKHYSDERADRFRARGITLSDIGTVVASADFLTIHLPLNDETHHVIDAAALSRMKPGAFLINTARGGVVDESALYGELTRAGRLSGAALDVHEREGEGVVPRLGELPNVTLTPHIAAMAVEVQREIGQRVVKIIGALEAGALDAEALGAELVA